MELFKHKQSEGIGGEFSSHSIRNTTLSCSSSPFFVFHWFIKTTRQTRHNIDLFHQFAFYVSTNISKSSSFSTLFIIRRSTISSFSFKIYLKSVEKSIHLQQTCIGWVYSNISSYPVDGSHFPVLRKNR